MFSYWNSLFLFSLTMITEERCWKWHLPLFWTYIKQKSYFKDNLSFETWRLVVDSDLICFNLVFYILRGESLLLFPLSILHCKCRDSGQVSGRVLVYRNPGLHFGDVHVMKARYVEELVDIVGDAKYGIVFSTKGPRSAASEIANGDFDGDMYWVSINRKVGFQFLFV